VLPGTLLTGLGVALCLPQLSSAAVQGLPPDRFAAGAAVGQAVRQLGATLGVALVIALLGRPGPDELLDRFQRVWLLIVAGGVLVSLASLPLRRPTPSTGASTPPGDRSRAVAPVAAPAPVAAVASGVEA
jgi:hypothetical protein